jgi:hypothetical protein
MTWSPWLWWAALFASLSIWVAMPRFATPLPDPWNAAETAVAGFVLAILALVAGLGTFALRESLVERDADATRGASADGGARVQLRLVELWLLCAVIGALGGIMIRHSGRPATGLPYLIGAGALFVIHAPTRRLCQRLRAGATRGDRP